MSGRKRTEEEREKGGERTVHGKEGKEKRKKKRCRKEKILLF
jgi:hypothetical protein